jgi:hypothetical protein
VNVEWGIPFVLTTPYGVLNINDYGNPMADSGVTLKLDPSKCGTSAGIRLTRDNRSQKDGSIVHREFTEGYTIHFGGWLMLEPDVPACDADLRAAWDEIQLHMHVLLGNDQHLDGDTSRLTWQPTGFGDTRLLGDLRLLEEAQAAVGEAITEVAFALHSPYPYAISGTENTETLVDVGASAVITNGGNVPTFPVFKIHGPIAGMAQLTNVTTGHTFIYDTALPGASVIDVGDYGLVGTFAENIYLNGAGLNLKPGVDVEQSDYWPLAPGPNTVQIENGDSGVTIDVIWNDAWY